VAGLASSPARSNASSSSAMKLRALASTQKGLDAKPNESMRPSWVTVRRQESSPTGSISHVLLDVPYQGSRADATRPRVNRDRQARPGEESTPEG
jgi:hypothetical protein